MLINEKLALCFAQKSSRLSDTGRFAQKKKMRDDVNITKLSFRKEIVYLRMTGRWNIMQQ